MEKKLLVVKVADYKLEILNAFCIAESVTFEQVVDNWIDSLANMVQLAHNDATKMLYDQYVNTLRGVEV